MRVSRGAHFGHLKCGPPTPREWTDNLKSAIGISIGRGNVVGNDGANDGYHLSRKLKETCQMLLMGEVQSFCLCTDNKAMDIARVMGVVTPCSKAHGCGG